MGSFLYYNQASETIQMIQTSIQTDELMKDLRQAQRINLSVLDLKKNKTNLVLH